MNARRRFPVIVRRALAGFLRSRRGGGMLVGGIFVLLTMTVGGERMTDYAWREAQFEELQSGLRAAVAASGALLGDLGTPSAAGAVAGIQSRVAQFVTALLPGVSVDAADVGVAHDRSTGVTTITVAGERIVDGIWYTDDEATEFESEVRVQYTRDRFEVATVLDMSRSMDCGFGRGCPRSENSRLDALKTTMATVADTMAATIATRPGTLLVSVVPFAGAVNVADTGGTGRTAAKERYVRMLVGPHDSTADMLRTARGLRDAGTGGHWVDTFHHYGTSADPGVLAAQYLPDAVLENRDWNLRQTGVRLDVSEQVPSLRTWVVDGADFWNGCVMARWGAYWDADARPAGWTADAAGNWPARQAVAGWSPRAAALPATTPLHLSDAPPDSDRPHTLFTAYSWPDARIGGLADARLQTAMARLLGASSAAPRGWAHPIAEIMSILGLPDRSDPLDALAALGQPNDWSLADGGGDAMCPPAPVTPLSEDVAAMRTAVADLSTVDVGPGRNAGLTLVSVGITWGLRTLSPLWRDVWEVTDARGATRPGVACAPGEERDCDRSLTKAIVIVTDGRANVGSRVRGRLRSGWQVNGGWTRHSLACDRALQMGNYFQAAADTGPAAFNGRFGTAVAADGKFNAAGRQGLVDALLRYGDTLSDTPARRAALETRLATADLTPWQMFRGLDAGTADFLVDPDNEIGLDGRPVLTGRHFCHWTTTFNAYGRTGDSVYAGEDSGAAIPPVRGVAPYAARDTGAQRGAFDTEVQYRPVRWTDDACEVAGRRGVRIFAILIGADNVARDNLERCVDAAGGTSGRQDVFLTPDAAALQAAFDEIFTIEQNLRFL